MKKRAFFNTARFFFRRLIIGAVLTSFLCIQLPKFSHAQPGINLVSTSPQVLSPSQTLTPPRLTGITVHPDNPLIFDFFVDDGNADLNENNQQQEYQRLIHYFMTALTMPEQDMWVNLSPIEEDRVIAGNFAQTELGRDLLKQDYLLKQFTSSMLYPENEPGRDFWTKIYAKAYEEFGTTEIPMDGFHKIWIVPDEAVVYEEGSTAMVGEARLKVLLEEDYVLTKNALGLEAPVSSQEPTVVGTLFANVLRDVIVPVVTEEVNHNEYFSSLRQIYHSFILASWFKRRLKDSVYGRTYTDQQKIAGMELDETDVKEKIYQQYLDAYKQGAYNYIKEEYDPYLEEIIPRKYFSGGVQLRADKAMIIRPMVDMPKLNPIARTLKSIRVMTKPIISELVGALMGNPDQESQQNFFQYAFQQEGEQRQFTFLNFSAGAHVADNDQDLIIVWRSRYDELERYRIVIRGAASLLDTNNGNRVSWHDGDTPLYRIESLLKNSSLAEKSWDVIAETPVSSSREQQYQTALTAEDLKAELFQLSEHAGMTFHDQQQGALEIDYAERFRENMTEFVADMQKATSTAAITEVAETLTETQSEPATVMANQVETETQPEETTQNPEPATETMGAADRFFLFFENLHVGLNNVVTGFFEGVVGLFKSIGNFAKIQFINISIVFTMLTAPPALDTLQVYQNLNQEAPLRPNQKTEQMEINTDGPGRGFHIAARHGDVVRIEESSKIKWAVINLPNHLDGIKRNHFGFIYTGDFSHNMKINGSTLNPIQWFHHLTSNKTMKTGDSIGIQSTNLIEYTLEDNENTEDAARNLFFNGKTGWEANLTGTFWSELFQGNITSPFRYGPIEQFYQDQRILPLGGTDTVLAFLTDKEVRDFKLFLSGKNDLKKRVKITAIKNEYTPPSGDVIKVNPETGTADIEIPDQLDGKPIKAINLLLTGHLDAETNSYRFLRGSSTNTLQAGDRLRIGGNNSNASLIKYTLDEDDSIQRVVEKMLYGGKKENSEYGFIDSMYMHFRVFPETHELIDDFQQYWVDNASPIKDMKAVTMLLSGKEVRRLLRNMENDSDLRSRVSITRLNGQPIVSNDKAPEGDNIVNERSSSKEEIQGEVQREAKADSHPGKKLTSANVKKDKDNSQLGGIDFDQALLTLKTTGEVSSLMTPEQLQWLEDQPILGFESIILNISDAETPAATEI